MQFAENGQMPDSGKSTRMVVLRYVVCCDTQRRVESLQEFLDVSLEPGEIEIARWLMDVGIFGVATRAKNQGPPFAAVPVDLVQFVELQAPHSTVQIPLQGFE